MSQVVFDGAWREKELRRDLLVRQALGHDACDLQLLWCELLNRAGTTFPSALARGAKLNASSVGPRSRAELLEDVERST